MVTVREMARETFRSRAVRYVVLPLLLAAFAYFVFPTPYYYLGNYRDGLVRVNRLTQKAQLLTRHGWRELDPSQPDPHANP